VAAIRDLLDEHGHSQVSIMSYAAKFASAYYGPFREAAGSAPGMGDRKSYQADPRDGRGTIRDALLDEDEGADILMVKAFFLGLMRFQILELPMQPGVLIHLGLVAILMIIFPISKLMHAPGLFFAPSRTQVDNAREFRHLSAWAKQLPPLPEGIPEEGEG